MFTPPYKFSGGGREEQVVDLAGTVVVVWLFSIVFCRKLVYTNYLQLHEVLLHDIITIYKSVRAMNRLGNNQIIGSIALITGLQIL